MIANGSDDNSRELADRMVQSEAGCGIAINHRSRIHSGLRRGKGCSLDPAIPE